MEIEYMDVGQYGGSVTFSIHSQYVQFKRIPKQIVNCSYDLFWNIDGQ